MFKTKYALCQKKMLQPCLIFATQELKPLYTLDFIPFESNKDTSL
jgi:hypothetical protein